jgi:hypothetical protein
MHGYVFAWRWLAHAAVGGFFVLALGTLAALCCRQPVRRARVIVLTVLAAFAVPLLSNLPMAPKLVRRFRSDCRPGNREPCG